MDRYPLAEDVERELMELWSNVEKERASQQELVALRVTWRSDDSRRSATDPHATEQRKAASLNSRAGSVHEATLLKDISADAAAGEEKTYLRSTTEHVAQPADPGAQSSNATTSRHDTQVCAGNSIVDKGEQACSQAGGVGSRSLESAPGPGEGSGGTGLWQQREG